ncbi:MAG: hypothetical protein ACLGIF_07005, partial [Actinomycetes bacterium]
MNPDHTITGGAMRAEPPPRPARGAPALATLLLLGLVAGCGSLPGPAAGPASADASTPTAAPGTSPGSTAFPTSSRSATATTTSPTSPSPTATSPSPSLSPCATLAASLSLAEQVGQVFMVGVDSSNLDAPTAAVLGDLRAGSVVLLGNTSIG